MIHPEKLIREMEYLIVVAEQDNELELEIYVDMYREWLKLMLHLGPYIKMGLKAIEDNIKHYYHNRDLMVKFGFIKATSEEYTDMFKFCELETKLGI